jgi:hypothetical protein
MGDAGGESLPKDQRPGNQLVSENVRNPVEQFDQDNTDQFLGENDVSDEQFLDGG